MPADLILRAVLVVVAVAGVLLDTPVPVRTALSAAAVAAVTQRLATRRGHGSADAALVGAGALLAVLVVTGLLLDLAHVALRPDSWAVALGLFALVALAADRRAGQPAPRTRPARAELLRIAPWVVATAAVLLFAVTLAVRSTSAADGAPVQLSLASLQGTSAQIVVSADTGTGPLELRSDSGGSTLSYPLFRLKPGSSRTTDVIVPRGRTIITVSNPGQSQPLRSLVVDR